MLNRIVTIHTRWPAEVDPAHPTEVNIIIPVGPNGAKILTDDFVRVHHLSEAEVDTCEHRVLREIAIKPE